MVQDTQPEDAAREFQKGGFQVIKMWMGPPRGFEDLGRMAIYFQGAGEHW